MIGPNRIGASPLSRASLLAFRVAGYALVAALFLAPLAWVLASSLRRPGPLYQYASPLSWRLFIPDRPTLANFAHALTSLGMDRALRNTAFVAVTTALAGLVVNSMAGFALAALSFPGKNMVFAAVMVAFMAPFDAIVIPLHRAVSSMGLVNSWAALILPAVGNGMAIFLFRQFYHEYPKEILEAARVDGASWLRLFWQVVLPSSGPALAAAAVLIFMHQWNSLFWPLVAAYSEKYTMAQVIVASQIAVDGTRWASLFATSVLSSIPPMMLFFLLQKHYLRGIGGFGGN
ncbi:MAG: carbohydrate ABC transporter permease [Bacillota bacterium]|mgnify:CR=1 FL=1